MYEMITKLKDAKRIVVKVGTSTLTHETGLVNLRRFEELVNVLSDLQNSGREIVLVSSGAMAVGRGKLGITEKPAELSANQATAAIGQGELMHLYDTMFSRHHHTVAQILLTRDVVDEPERLKLVKNTFQQLLEWNCIPIVNENDTVSVEEIQFGDNDSLSAIVANIVQADALIILTDIDGLYDCDPRENENAKLISCVPEITKEILECASGAGSTRGTGGMITKVSAAQVATAGGIDVCIMNGSSPTLLYDALEGSPIGTYFAAEGDCYVDESTH